MLCNLETTFGNLAPEVIIHTRIGVFERNVADNTERNKRHIIYIAHLRNRATLHIY